MSNKSMQKKSLRWVFGLSLGLWVFWFLGASANPVPVQLPKPDNKPVDTKKPVKVYILAGQSNMVGMGDISGARPEFPTVFLSADPAVIPGEIGRFRSVEIRLQVDLGRRLCAGKAWRVRCQGEFRQ
jgi:hypothetical protein